MKFAHLGDCHLGGWRQPELRALNFQSFQLALSKCIKEKVNFILIAGDLFDSAYPSIETLKSTFREFRKLKEEGIPVFLIAGSHDYSASGKTFLDVLEKAGFCKNVAVFEERGENIILEPTIYGNVAIYGYPGKKSGLEVDEIPRIKLQDSPGLFKILMLHTAIRDAVKNLPIKAVDEKLLPKSDYLALAHLHINYNKDGRVYSGPIFPNNLSELEELKGGTFYIVENSRIKREHILTKEVISFSIDIKNSLGSTDLIISLLSKENLKDKIVILRPCGIIEQGKISDIDFVKIEKYARDKGAYSFLKSTSKLHMSEPEIKIDFIDSADYEAQIIKKFQESNTSKFGELIPQVIKALQAEKLEDEKLMVFEERLLEECKRALPL